MIRSALVLVPHQDDEINVAGCLFDQLISAGVRITVCFATNGDYTDQQHIRLAEAKKVSALLGTSMLYLGYGDGGYEGNLYNAAQDDAVIVSPAGHSETYSVGDMCDFRFLQHGEHSPYTRNALRQDIKDLLLAVRADLVFCVDADEHPDHALLSQTFDKAMAELVQESDYRPLVLKKFAYLGTWYGKDDYFMRPMRATECVSYGLKETRVTSEPYAWGDRIRFAVNPRVYPLRFWKSPLFKALKIYNSQMGIAFFPHIVNSDAVYWFYDTKNGYTLSSHFPVEETPFTLYVDSPSVHGKERTFFKMLYKAYYFFFFRVPRKLRRMTRHGI